MLPPPSTRPTFLPANRVAVAKQRRERRRARALDHRLLDLEQHHDRLLDVALVHEEDLAHVLLDDRARERARLLHRDALGDGGGGERAASVPFIAWYIAGKRTISTPYTSMAGFSAFAAIEMPEIRPPPPMATTSASSSGCSRQHLEARGALPRDDLLVVVGMDQREAALDRGREREFLGRVEVVALEDHLRAEARVCSTFTNGVKRGITITAGMPRREA